ncbi:MAG: lectin repeat-containing protein, partial [Acidimicrobiales bacterium]|nr:lectin repeat-containing protein [Acidimicrobiales bacterium]
DSGTVQGVHVGCTWDRPFQDGLVELKTWLVAHPDQFVLLYLENQLDDTNGPNPQAHEIAAQLIAQGLGSLVYQPPAGQPCAPMPTGTSRADLAKGGHQVLIVGNCGPGAWGSWVHERAPHWDEHGDPSTYGDTACVADKQERAGDPALFRRVFEDSTWVTATTGDGSNHLSTPSTVAKMVQCGINIIGLDQLQPQDPRLAALVWSWAQDEPRAGAGDCAFQGGDGRFHASGCTVPRHFACADPSGGWHVTAATGPQDGGAAACTAEFTGSRFGVPANGLRNQLVVEAKASAGDEVWLNYAAVNGSWTPA